MRIDYHMSMITTSSRTGRLSADQVSFFRAEGYLIYSEPILPQSEFDALKDHFEQKLARLPADVRPESMDVPHFTDTKLFRWLFHPAVLDLVEPLLGPDIALFSSHFICKPRGTGKRETNKESQDADFPAYVAYFTDFSQTAKRRWSATSASPIRASRSSNCWWRCKASISSRAGRRSDNPRICGAY